MELSPGLIHILSNPERPPAFGWKCLGEALSKALHCLQKPSSRKWIPSMLFTDYLLISKAMQIEKHCKAAQHLWETAVHCVKYNQYRSSCMKMLLLSSVRELGTQIWIEEPKYQQGTECYLMRHSFVWRVSVILASSFCNCSWCSLELSMKSSWDCKVALSSIFSFCSTCTRGRRNDCCKMDQTSWLQCDERLIS